MASAAMADLMVEAMVDVLAEVAADASLAASAAELAACATRADASSSLSRRATSATRFHGTHDASTKCFCPRLVFQSTRSSTREASRPPPGRKPPFYTAACPASAIFSVLTWEERPPKPA